MHRESGASSIPRLSCFIATLRVTGSPAFAGDDIIGDEWSAPSMEDLMKDKRGWIMGVANDHSIAWGIAKALAAEGAELAFTYQGEALGKRVRPLAETLGASLILPCDVEDLRSVDLVFTKIARSWEKL